MRLGLVCRKHVDTERLDAKRWNASRKSKSCWFSLISMPSVPCMYTPRVVILPTDYAWKWKCLTSRLRKKFSRRRRKLISMSKDAPRSPLSNAHRYTSFGGKTLKWNRKNFAPPPTAPHFGNTFFIYIFLISRNILQLDELFLPN